MPSLLDLGQCSIVAVYGDGQRLSASLIIPAGGCDNSKSIPKGRFVLALGIRRQDYAFPRSDVSNRVWNVSRFLLLGECNRIWCCALAEALNEILSDLQIASQMLRAGAHRSFLHPMLPPPAQQHCYSQFNQTHSSTPKLLERGRGIASHAKRATKIGSVTWLLKRTAII
jgi:hypothetical protein